MDIFINFINPTTTGGGVNVTPTTTFMSAIPKRYIQSCPNFLTFPNFYLAFGKKQFFEMDPPTAPAVTSSWRPTISYFEATTI